MTYEHVEHEIRSRKSDTQSIGDQIKISHAMWEAGIGPDHEGLRAAQIEDELGLSLEYNIGTSLHHLKDIEILGAYFKANTEWFPKPTWRGEDADFVFGDELDEAVREAITAVIDHMSDVPDASDSRVVADGAGGDVRRVVADEFDYDSEKIDDYLREHDEDVDTLNKAVEAIRESDDIVVRDDYGEIDFVPRAYYYRLTGRAVGLYEK